MTQADFNSKYGRLAMPCPFGNNDSANIAQIADAKSKSNFNFETGFATPYSAPKSKGGTFVTRKEMNAIGNLASRNDFYRMCGGLNTFDASIANSIGGYPKGAVLEHIVGYKLYKVISLVDSNKWNFVVDGIDGVNWQYLNQDIAEAEREKAFSFGINANSQTTIGVFKSAKTTDTFLVESKIEKVYSGSSTYTEIMSSMDTIKILDSGAAIIMYDLGTSYTAIPDPFDGWKTLYGQVDKISLTKQQNVKSVNIDTIRWDTGGFVTGLTKDHYYAVLAYGAFRDLTYSGQESSSITDSTSVTFAESKFSLSGTFTIFY